MLTFTEPAAEPQEESFQIPANPSELKPAEFFKSVADRIEREAQEGSEDSRCETIFTMCRRFRGASSSDLFGFCKHGRWNDHELFNRLHGTNVFQALTRGAEANYTQAKIKLDITTSSSGFQNRSARKIAEGVYEKLRTTLWNEKFEAQTFYAATLKLNYVYLTRFNRGNDCYKLRVPEFGQVSYEQGGLAVCNDCDAPVQYSNLMQTQCQSCGSDSMTVINEPEMKQEMSVTGFREVPAGAVETVVLDGFDFRVDDINTDPNNLSKAQYFEYHYLVHKSELKKLYPHLKLDKNPQWSVPTRWKIALKRFENAPVSPNSKADREMYEVREIWLNKNQCEEYISPVDYQLGEFSIKAGQRLSEVTPDGAVFGLIGEEVVFVFDESLMDTVSGGTWLSDAVSYYGLGLRAGLPIQKKINQLDNINMDGIARAMRGSIIYDPEAINGASLEGSNTNIPLRAGFSRAGQPIKSFFEPLNLSGLSQDSVMFLENQRNIMQMIMGVPDAAIGEGDPHNQTLGGQQILAQRASGLLIPAKKSQAHAFELTLRQALKIIQKRYEPERIKEEFGSAYGEEWLDDEIEAFKNTDLDKVLIIRYVEGTEVPITREAKEAKLFALISAGLVMPTPDILAKLADVAGLDEFDIGNFESNKRLSQKRWNMVAENIEKLPEIEQVYAQLELTMLDVRTGQRAVDQMGNKIPNPILMQIMNAPELQVNAKSEDHNLQIEFWADKLRGLSAQINLSQLKIDICDAMIAQHEAKKFEMAMKDQTLMALSGMPAQLGGKMLDNATNPPEQENGKPKPSK